MSLLGVIGIVLVILKLAGLIALSWGWVLFPFYIIPLIWIVFIVFGGGLAYIFNAPYRKRRRF